MYHSQRGQASVFDNPENFMGAKLNPKNRWVKMSEMIPRDLIDEKYSANFKTLNAGNPAKAARMAVGALIIREATKTPADIQKAGTEGILEIRKEPKTEEKRH